MKFDQDGLVHITRSNDFWSLCGAVNMDPANDDMTAVYKKAAVSMKKPATCMACIALLPAAEEDYARAI